MNRKEDDLRFMRRALALAELGRGRTAPNPMVGCVLVDKKGRMVGHGYHKKAGLPHAEIEALKVAGKRARGATAYVTLEPCDHTGRTGPCTVALIAAGVSRVVAAMADPNPRVDGKGLKRLRKAGIAVEMGVCGGEARALNEGFVTWVTTGRPRVTLKAAVSLDGRIAASSGDARWITGEEARREAHRMRDACDAILVGAGTVRADDPELTTRIPGGRDALRVILDGKLAMPARAKVVAKGTLIATTRGAPAGAEAALARRGAEVVRLPGKNGRVAMGALLDELGRRGVLELLVEGGSEVHGALLEGGFADRAAIFVAPVVIGAAGVPLAAAAGAKTMGEAWRLSDVSTRRLGDDIMLIGTIVRRAARKRMKRKGNSR